MEITNTKIGRDQFLSSRQAVLDGWPTGKEVDLDEAAAWHAKLPPGKHFPEALEAGLRDRKILLQPRAGVPLVNRHIELLQMLEAEADLLPTTIDAYTRQNRYEEAGRGIEESRRSGLCHLNGFPAVNHGVSGCRKVIDHVSRPVQVRHGTPDSRLLAEITLAAGFTGFEGGGISYNIPYAKRISLEQSLRHWQYVDRLVGEYRERGVTVNREQFGPLTGTLVPPFASHAVAILEGIFALEQGVGSLTLGYGQTGNLYQDTAAIRTLEPLAREYFDRFGYRDYSLTSVFHQWMGGFPEDEAKAFAVIAWGGATAALAGATRVIVKTPYEALGVPTGESNLNGLKATRQAITMLSDQALGLNPEIEREMEIIGREVRSVLEKVFELGGGDPARGTVRAFEEGVLDIPFAPSSYNHGRLLPVRDLEGAVRVLEKGNVPLDPETLAFHREKIADRARAEGREPCFQMVTDDIYAVSRGRLTGHPR